MIGTQKGRFLSSPIFIWQGERKEFRALKAQRTKAIFRVFVVMLALVAPVFGQEMVSPEKKEKPKESKEETYEQTVELNEHNRIASASYCFFEPGGEKGFSPILFGEISPYPENPPRIKRPEDPDKILVRNWDPRIWLEEHGLTFSLVYTAEGFWNTRGGISTHHARKYRGDVSLFLELDTESAGLWEDGTFFAHLQHEHGDSITEKYVGDFQVLSNMDADDFTQVSEIWYRHSFLDGKLWAKLGKQEANEDFAGVEYGGEFINSSAGFSPTIPLVTFPDPDWGMVWSFEPVESFSVNTGVYQGRPDGGRSIKSTLDNLYGPMVMVEPAFHYNVSELSGHFRLGGWWNGDRFDEFDKDDPDAGTFGRSYGWYLTWDQEIFKENPKEEEDGQGIGLFGQYGWTPEDRSEAEQYLGGGIQWIGAIPARDEDVLGLGIFHVNFSDEVDFEEHDETAIEFFYKVQLHDSLSIKPDVQYIINPGGTSNDDALSVGLRLELSF
ncbi:MAG: carbohydrate porin [Planctomycetota bacterium]